MATGYRSQSFFATEVIKLIVQNDLLICPDEILLSSISCHIIPSKFWVEKQYWTNYYFSTAFPKAIVSIKKRLLIQSQCTSWRNCYLIAESFHSIAAAASGCRCCSCLVVPAVLAQLLKLAVAFKLNL